MPIELEIQIASTAKTLPHPSQFREWISMALWDRVDDADMTIRIVDEDEITDLNLKYCGKDKPTNVLSFPAEFDPKIPSNLLGDIVICATVIEQEAAENDKLLLAHWAHIVIHGALHLLGFDHENEDDANEMENLEIELLNRLGYPSPYGDIS